MISGQMKLNKFCGMSVNIRHYEVLRVYRNFTVTNASIKLILNRRPNSMFLGQEKSKSTCKFVNTKKLLSHLSRIFLPIISVATMGILESVNAAPFNGCNGSDCVQHNLQTQTVCVQVGTESTPNAPVGPGSGWAKGLNTEIDQNILKGNVVAYKIQWSSGWSGWFVTGVNDLDIKFNTDSGNMRRMWSYFTDHRHLYIVCKQP
ncbi:hypothetical protein [Synechocystis sp. LEGE 06083]|uniref:hypothetical protein n=1 Tax=Synechocystis sp. LEGE 06083 TaxID=915336 RepID=UPI00187EC110|nr:hypothetical protein [Synechocystis sp. LEGE 06083]